MTVQSSKRDHSIPEVKITVVNSDYTSNRNFIRHPIESNGAKVSHSRRSTGLMQIAPTSHKGIIK
jgi:hypothetical protein